MAKRHFGGSQRNGGSSVAAPQASSGEAPANPPARNPEGKRLGTRAYELAHDYLDGNATGPEVRDFASLLNAVVHEAIARSRGVDVDAMNAV